MKIMINNTATSANFLLLFLFLISCSNKEPMENINDTQKKNFSLSEAQMQLGNIRVAEVKEGSIGRQLLLTGVLKVDEQSALSISCRIPGRVLKLFFKNSGDYISTGDSLYELYSEDLLSLQKEFLGLQNNTWDAVAKAQYNALENKLLLIGMLPSQIARLKTDKKLTPVLKIYSSGCGIIRTINVYEGQYIATGQLLFELANDSLLVAEAMVYPDELQYLKTGMPVNIIIPVAGDSSIISRISFINPAYEARSNVTLVRVNINNYGKMLHPGMPAMVGVQINRISGMVIPSSSVLIDKLGSLVWVQNKDGSFASRRIVTGIHSADSVFVVSGLKLFDKVVVSGAYLINSEVKLNSGIFKTTEMEL